MCNPIRVFWKGCSTSDTVFILKMLTCWYQSLLFHLSFTLRIFHTSTKLFLCSEHLIQIHTPHEHWISILPWPLTSLWKGKELAHCSTAWAEPELFQLNFTEFHQMKSLLYNTDFSWVAEECGSPVIGTHVLVPLFKNRDCHTSLPVQKHCLRSTCNFEYVY